MEHIAHEVGKDPLSVRLRNTITTDPTESLVTSIKEKSNFDQRKSSVEEFNKVGYKNYLFKTQDNAYKATYPISNK